MYFEVKTYVHYVRIKYESLLYRFLQWKAIWSESGEKYLQLKHRLQAKTVENSSEQISGLIFMLKDNRRWTCLLDKALLWINSSYFIQKQRFEVKTYRWICFLQTYVFTSQDVNWCPGVLWITCGLLWCSNKLFGLSIWRHPLIADNALVRKWCNAT